MKIVLIGPRGAGKTSVGKIVARRLRLNFLDTDQIVEKTAGKAIVQIFRTKGERCFRSLESSALRDLKHKGNVVIAAGGGAVLRKSNVVNLRSGEAIVFYLSAPAEILHYRCEKDSRTPSQRPPLTSESGLAEMRRVLKIRRPLYRAAADFTIDTSCFTPAKTAREIVAIAKRHLSTQNAQ